MKKIMILVVFLTLLTHVTSGQTSPHWKQITGRPTIVDVKMYGAVGNGVTDDTAALQAAATAAFNNGLPLHIPGGSYLFSSDLNIRSSIFCAGELHALVSEAGIIPRVNILPDTNVSIIASAAGLNGLTAGSTKIVGLNGHAGKTLLITSTDEIVKRATGGAQVVEFAFDIVTDAGDITPPLPTAITAGNINVLAVKTSKPTTVQGLVIKLVGTFSGAESGEYALRISRSNVTFTDIEVVNTLAAPSQCGISTYGATNLIFNNCYIYGFDAATLGYGMLNVASSNIQMRGTRVARSKKSVDGNTSINVSVTDSSGDGGFGPHWGYNYSFDNVTAIIDSASVQVAFGGAGKDLSVTNSHITFTGTNSTTAFRVRPDYWELAGIVKFENNTVNFNAAAPVKILFADNVGYNFDWGRTTVRPYRLIIRDNTVSHSARISLGAGNIYVPISATTNYGIVIVEDNSDAYLEYYNENTTLDLVNTRTMAYISRTPSSTPYRFNNSQVSSETWDVNVYQCRPIALFNNNNENRYRLWDSQMIRASQTTAGGSEPSFFLNNSTVGSLTNNLPADQDYYFSQCYFFNDIVMDDATASVRLSEKNFGDVPVKFPLDGVYKP